VILLDTSGVIAALAPNQRYHEEAAAALLAAEPPLILSPFVLAEIDYLLMKLASADAALRFLEEVARGAYLLAVFDSSNVARVCEIAVRYREVGIADASIVVLAELFHTRDVLTLDERHFRAFRLDRNKRFRILPADRR